jgi:hypothetical protein
LIAARPAESGAPARFSALEKWRCSAKSFRMISDLGPTLIFLTSQ